MDHLPPSLRRALRARAHHLHPVVSIGQHGLTPAVVHEIDVALTAHELIKVRVFSDKRDEREALLVRVCDQLACAAVQQIGKLLVLWRPRPAAVASEHPRQAGHHERHPAHAPRESAAVPGRRRRAAVATGPTPAPDQARVRKARGSSGNAIRTERPGRKPQGNAAFGEPARARKTGKAPPGVPRAAAPRRRRRAP